MTATTGTLTDDDTGGVDGVDEVADGDQGRERGLHGGAVEPPTGTVTPSVTDNSDVTVRLRP